MKPVSAERSVSRPADGNVIVCRLCRTQSEWRNVSHTGLTARSAKRKGMFMNLSFSRVARGALLPVLLRTIAFAALTFCMARNGAAAPAQSALVGDPKNPGELTRAVQDAYKGGARRITIRPGTYLLPKVEGSYFVLDGWKDAAIQARGVTLIATGNLWNHELFDLRHCVNVTLEGAALSQTSVTFYQGRIVAVGQDAAGKAYADWKPDAGYPVPPEGAKKFPSALNIVDGKTRLFKIGVGDFYDAPMDAPDKGIYRIHFKSDTLHFSAGDFGVGRYGDWGFKIHLDACRDCVIKDVTLSRSGFAPIREEGSGGGNHLLGVKWTPGPRPEGATEEPLIHSAADGFHSTDANPGPDIEDCAFKGLMLDDCIAIHGYFKKVKNADGNTLTIEDGAGALKVGEPARISDDKGFFGEAIVTDIKNNADKTAAVTLDRELGVPGGAKLSNPRSAGAGFRILRCHLGNTRSRAILVKADNGLISGNTIEYSGMSAVSIGPEYYWGEADYAQNVTVENNLMRENGRAGYGGGAVLIHGDGAMGNKNITLKNNRFQSNYQGDIDAQWTRHLTISGNVITGATPWPSAIGPQSAFLLANCRAVTLRDNLVKNSAAYKSALVSTGANLSDVTGNDSSGARADKAATGAYLHDGAPTDTNIRYIGRWDRRDKNVSRSHWGGAYLYAKFTGTSVALAGGATAGGPNFMVSVDGEPLHEVKALNVQSLKPGVHTLLAGSPGQNGEVEFRGLTLDKDAATLPTPARPVIEFVGDSITTGGGQTLPSTINYAWMSAEALNADHVQIAFSARALTTGFGCASDKAALDTQYFQMKNFNHLSDNPSIAWDFSYAPSLVVINLGQNDQCGREPEETFTASYVRFVRRIRARLPDAQIVMLRPFGGAYEKAARKAADLLQSGDRRVTFVDTSGWLEKADFVDGTHPTEAGHAKVARRLVPLLQPLPGDGRQAILR